MEIYYTEYKIKNIINQETCSCIEIKKKISALC